MAAPVVTYEVMVDFDATDWAAEPDFTQAYDELSADGINYIAWHRGKQREDGNAPAATLEINMEPGLHGTYSPFTTGTLAGKIRPWLPVRVRAYYNTTYYAQYFGYISRIRINPWLDVQSVSFYVTDGTDLMARQLIAQDPDSLEKMSDGDAINKILDSAGWSPIRRSIDDDGGDDLLNYPATGDY